MSVPKNVNPNNVLFCGLIIYRMQCQQTNETFMAFSPLKLPHIKNQMCGRNIHSSLKVLTYLGSVNKTQPKVKSNGFLGSFRQFVSTQC